MSLTKTLLIGCLWDRKVFDTTDVAPTPKPPFALQRQPQLQWGQNFNPEGEGGEEAIGASKSLRFPPCIRKAYNPGPNYYNFATGVSPSAREHEKDFAL